MTASAELGPERPRSPDGEDRAAFPPDATAQYIAEMTSALAAMAREGRLDFLAHLLDIAQLEAATAANRLAAVRRAGEPAAR